MSPKLEADPSLLEEDAAANVPTLSLLVLLGIFFSVALLCAIGLGLIYSPARFAPRNTADKTADRTQLSTKSPAKPLPRPTLFPGDTGEATAPGLSADKPSLSAAYTPAPGEPVEPTPTAPESASVLPASPPSVTTPPAGEPLTPEATPLSVPPETSPAPIPATYMVQVAAVTTAAAADTLAHALRHDGFAAIVRTSVHDDFFHVQLGPYSGFQAAEAMRTSLLNSGYKAYVRQ